MPTPDRQDSNTVGLRWADYPGLSQWNLLDPNSFGTWGKQLEKVTRRILAVDRQSKKGSIVGQTTRGEFQSDLTYNNTQNLLPMFFYAAFREQTGLAIASVDGSGEAFGVASGGTAFIAGNLVFSSGLTPSLGNNGFHRVTGSTGTTVTVASNLVTETAPAGAQLYKVGHQFGAGALDVDVSGPYPVLVCSGFDFTTLNLPPGCEVFLGGDTAITRFVNAANNGPKRVRRVIDATHLELDKSTLTMLAESSTTETIQMFVGRVIKNESTASLIVQKVVEFERTLGPGDTALPGNLQAEYLLRATGDQMVINMPAKSLVTCDYVLRAQDSESRSSVVGVKAGTRPGIEDKVPVNTSSDVMKLSMTQVINGNEAPPQLLKYLSNLKLTLNNNTQENPALGIMGSIALTPGDFEVGVEVEGYFQTEDILSTIAGNIDVTLANFFVRNNQGIAFDMPLTTLQTDGLKVERNKAIMLPITIDGHSGEGIDPLLDHTLCMTFFPYLPTFAKAALNSL